MQPLLLSASTSASDAVSIAVLPISIHFYDSATATASDAAVAVGTVMERFRLLAMSLLADRGKEKGGEERNDGARPEG